MAGLTTSLTVSTPEETEPFRRADIVFSGVDHSGSSFEARVFLNRDDADETTPTDAEHGFAGSFHVFGHGRCFGDAGHCDVPPGPVSVFDRRLQHQLTPTTKILIATDAIRRAISEPGTSAVKLKVVPIVRPSPAARAEDAEDVLHVEDIAIVTYD
jgi:tyrosinase